MADRRSLEIASLVVLFFVAATCLTLGRDGGGGDGGSVGIPSPGSGVDRSRRLLIDRRFNVPQKFTGDYAVPHVHPPDDDYPSPGLGWDFSTVRSRNEHGEVNLKAVNDQPSNSPEKFVEDNASDDRFPCLGPDCDPPTLKTDDDDDEEEEDLTLIVDYPKPSPNLPDPHDSPSPPDTRYHSPPPPRFPSHPADHGVKLRS